MITKKILALPSHTFKDRVSGVDMVRITQPMRALDGYKDSEVEFQVKVFDHAKDGSFDWRDVFQKYDIVYFNYTTNDIGYAIMGTLAQKYNRKLVVDIDDALWVIKKDNAAYETFRKGSWGNQVITAICKDVSYVTCTNKYLRNIIFSYTNKPFENIKVFTNQIDLNLYKYRYHAKDSYPIKIHWFGSSTHFTDMVHKDFVAGLDRIMKEYPNVVFETTGISVPDFKNRWGQRYVVSFGDPDILKWVKNRYSVLMKEADIVVSVLENTPYDMAKSDIKFLEYSAAGKPGVYSDVRPYSDVIKHGKTGYLARTAEDWYTYLKRLIDSKELREKIGNRAYNYVKDNRTVGANIQDYVDFFKSI